MDLPLAPTAAMTSANKGPENVIGLSYHGLRVVKVFLGKASIMAMSNW